ncbi:hypothetical protein EMIT053CA3_70161 [Pseudomonas donghuensis]
MERILDRVLEGRELKFSLEWSDLNSSIHISINHIFSFVYSL